MHRGGLLTAVLLAVAAPAAAQTSPTPLPAAAPTVAAPTVAAPAVAAPAAGAAAPPPADVTPVDPYEPDADAPEVPADEARGWRVPPKKGERPAPVRWVVDTTGSGLRWMLKAGIAPVKGALYLDREYKVRRRVEDFFYNEERTAAILPELGFFSGLGFTLGGQAFHQDLFGNGESIRLVALRGGAFDQSVELDMEAPRIAGGRFYADGFARVEETPNQVFSGIGRGGVLDEMPTAVIDPRAGSFETRFRQRRFLGIASVGSRFDWGDRRVRVGPSVIANVRQLDPLAEERRSEVRVSIDEVYDLSELPSFQKSRVTTVEFSVDYSIDARDNPGAPSDGWLVEGFAGGAPNLDGFAYGHWGVEGSLYQTLFRERRVFMARFGIEGVLGRDRDVPFTDLPRLGGPATLRGFRNERFRDKLAVLGTLEYRYPIHSLVSGLLFVEAGSVARGIDELFVGPDAGIDVGFGGGLVVHTLKDFVLRTEIAYGEELRLFVSTDPLAAFRGRKKRL